MASGGALASDLIGLLQLGLTACDELDADGGGWPSGWDSIKLRRALELGDPKTLATVGRAVETTLRTSGVYEAFLAGTVGALPLKTRDVFDAFAELALPIATCNYDGLIEEALGRPALTWRDTALVLQFLNGQLDAVLHLFGHYSDPASIALSADTNHMLAGGEHGQRAQRLLFLERTLVFVGFGVGINDFNFGTLMRWAARLGPDRYGHYFFVRLNSDGTVRDLITYISQIEKINVLEYQSNRKDLPSYIRSLNSRPNLTSSPLMQFGRAEPPRGSGQPTRNQLLSLAKSHTGTLLGRTHATGYSRRHMRRIFNELNLGPGSQPDDDVRDDRSESLFRVTYQVSLEAKQWPSHEKLDKIIRELRIAANDPSLALKSIKPGSIIIEIEGTEEGFLQVIEKIHKLTLAELANHRILSIKISHRFASDLLGPDKQFEENYFGSSSIAGTSEGFTGNGSAGKSTVPWNPVTTAIISALPKEYAAMLSMLENCRELPGQDSRSFSQYVLGDIPTQGGGAHTVVLGLLPAMGNDSAASRAQLLLERFPEVRSIIMVGIAGGAPHPREPDEHVRLGDIVISNQQGIIQYDYVKEILLESQIDNPPRPLSEELLYAVHRLEAEELLYKRPWMTNIQLAHTLRGVARPPEDTDKLAATPPEDGFVAHPRDPNRIPGEPRVFSGPIGSANSLLRNPQKRDSIRDKFGTKAFEMEGSGIADAAWSQNIGYLVIRGICDYCDGNKNNTWQIYSSVVAAAYTRALVGKIATELAMPGRQVPPALHRARSQCGLAGHTDNQTVIQRIEALQRNPNRRDLRLALDEVLRRESRFSAFVLTYFPLVSRDYASSMDRTTKTNILIESIKEDRIAKALLDFIMVTGAL